ncbi:hypothetical protein KQY30_11140 [Streptomyces sp. GMY02]|uniref:hypothetical protein n=1 Tax=Streptomyces sp. GMY02 TaxID=1333528 RepID=UPI001C2BA06F|nr:hypothetical protein [Streptomyces sp. GMY02]QXE39048.1 hypothetical protein KQY30_11140 [Streptomyces sp. GMY02]
MTTKTTPSTLFTLYALYARSRILPATLAALACTALAAAWAAYWLQAQPRFGHSPSARVPVVVLAPLLAAGVIGTGLYTHSDELDRTAVRPWWFRRAAHLLVLTALAAACLALAVPGHPEEFGAPAIVRNLLGATGVTAGAAALLGARLSWLPMTVYVSGTYLSAPRTPGGAAAVWAWPMQPGPQAAAWVTAVVAYVVGAALYAWRGARRESR